MLPFQKDRHEEAEAVPLDFLKRTPDETSMLREIGKEMFQAIHNRDEQLFLDCLEAFAEQLKEEDEIQDQHPFHE